MNLSQVHDINLLLAVLSAVHLCTIVEQIIKLAAVDLIETDVKLEVGVQIEVLNDVIACQQVKSWYRAITCTHHSESLSAASLAIGETCRFGALERLRDEGEDALLVDLFIISCFRVCVVEAKDVLFYVLRQVDLSSIQDIEKPR